MPGCLWWKEESYVCVPTGRSGDTTLGLFSQHLGTGFGTPICRSERKSSCPSACQPSGCFPVSKTLRPSYLLSSKDSAFGSSILLEGFQVIWMDTWCPERAHQEPETMRAARKRSHPWVAAAASPTRSFTAISGQEPWLESGNAG